MSDHSNRPTGALTKEQPVGNTTGYRHLVCTVLPTYNERDNIGPLVLRLLAANPAPYRVLVVDDDSPDGTWRIVKDLMRAVNPKGQEVGKQVALVRRTEEKGLTSAIQRGIDEAIQIHHAAVVTWMDCDLSMPPEDVPRLVQAVCQDSADVAVGSRWIPGGADVAHGIMALILSRIINAFAQIALDAPVHDYTSGFIASRAEVLQDIRLRGDYGEYCIDFVTRAHDLGYQLQEVPYYCLPRSAGASKTGANIWDYLVKGRKYIATIWRLRAHGEAAQRMGMP